MSQIARADVTVDPVDPGLEELHEDLRRHPGLGLGVTELVTAARAWLSAA